jgi:hypothetical protein
MLSHTRTYMQHALVFLDVSEKRPVFTKTRSRRDKALRNYMDVLGHGADSEGGGRYAGMSEQGAAGQAGNDAQTVAER